VNVEDIKSPLPPRKVLFETEEETENQQPVQPVLNSNTPTSQPIVNTIKKNNKLFIILAILLISLVIGGLIFYVVKNKNVDKTVTLTYWGLWEDENVMNGIIADFESKNPNIKVVYKKNQKDGYRGRLAGRLAKSGSTTDDVPDIYRIHNTWISMFRDYLATVPSETVTSIGLDTDFFDVYKTDLKESGNWLSVPLMYDGLVMFYNPDLLSKAGVDVPKDWWSLKKAAIKITQRDTNNKITVAGASLGSVTNVDQWSDIVGLMMEQNGVNTKSIGSTENTTKLKDVFSFYILFKTSDKVWDDTLPNSTQYFASGNLGFYFGPSWRIFDIQALNPNLDFKITSTPQLPTTSSVSTETVDAGAELTNIHWASYWTEGVNNKSTHQEEAWKFLEYLSSAEVLEKMYQADSQIRSFGQIYPRKSMMSKISSNEKLKPLVDTANNATSWYLASNTWDNGLNTQMQKYFSDALNTISSNSSDSDDAVITAISGITQLQKKYELTK